MEDISKSHWHALVHVRENKRLVGLATEVKTKMQYAGGAGWKQAKQMFESRCRCRVAVLANREQNNMQEQQSLGQNESKPTKLAANELLAIVDHQYTD